MSIHQFAYRCWEVTDPDGDEPAWHFKDRADADKEVGNLREEDPATKASVRQLDEPCWMVECDGECETALDEEDEGYAFHHESYGEAEQTAAAWEWRLVPDPLSVVSVLVYCPTDAPESGRVPLLNPAQQEAAGQMRLPGVA